MQEERLGETTEMAGTKERGREGGGGDQLLTPQPAYTLCALKQVQLISPEVVWGEQ